MNCSKCGAEIIDTKKPCTQCGHVVTEQEDMNTIIKNILEEDDYKPKFEEAASEDKTVKKPTVIGQKKKAKARPMEKLAEKPLQKSVKDTSSRSIGDKIVLGLRYLLAGLIVLFTLSLFFDWVTLSGNAVNHGVLRTEVIKPFIDSSIREHSIDSLESYDGPIITFSAMDIYKFGHQIGDSYKTVNGVAGPSTSLVSLIQKYYMQSIFIMIIVNILSLLIVLVFKSLKGINIVRNLSVLNFAIIGLNYLGLRVPYFSMIAVKAKDLLSQTVAHPQIAMTRVGISFEDKHYAYVFQEKQGLVFAVVMLVLWLLVSIILTEVKHRRDEIAIDNGEI